MADQTSVTFTVVGTDADGNAQSEAIFGPDTLQTVETTKSFLTVTSVQVTDPVSDPTPYVDIGTIDTLDVSTAGKIVRGPVPMVGMDAMDPLWHTATANDDDTVDEYVVNKETPRDFWVYPNASASSVVMATVAVLPADATVPATDDIPDSILPIIGGITEYMLYCCWRGDDEHSPTWAKGERARQAAFNILGVKIQAETEYAPKELEKQ